MRTLRPLLIAIVLASLATFADGRKPKRFAAEEEPVLLEEEDETSVTAVDANATARITVFNDLQITNLTATTILASEVDVADSIKTRSILGTRMYAEDVAASGFVSAKSLLVKHGAKLKGEVETEVIKSSNRIESPVATISKLESNAAVISGVLEAGRIETQGIKVGAEIESLLQRMEQLEELVEKLMGGGCSMATE